MDANPQGETMSEEKKWSFTTRDEIEEVRNALKVYFPNKSSDRAAFNTVCDLAVKYFKAVRPEVAAPIYLVLCGWDYEGQDVKAIVASRAEADALVEKYRDQEHFSYDEVRVVEWRVGEVTDKRWEREPQRGSE